MLYEKPVLYKSWFGHLWDFKFECWVIWKIMICVDNEDDCGVSLLFTACLLANAPDSVNENVVRKKVYECCVHKPTEMVSRPFGIMLNSYANCAYFLNQFLSANTVFQLLKKGKPCMYVRRRKILYACQRFNYWEVEFGSFSSYIKERQWQWISIETWWVNSCRLQIVPRIH